MKQPNSATGRSEIVQVRQGKVLMMLRTMVIYVVVTWPFHAAIAQEARVGVMSLPWMKTYAAAPHAAYLEVASNTNASAAHRRVWLYFPSSKLGGVDRLLAYADYPDPALRGCMGSSSTKCGMSPSQSALLLPRIAACFDNSKLNEYFVSSDASSFICLAKLVPELAPGPSTRNIALLIGIDARSRPAHNPLLLNDLFATAPYWTPSDLGMNRIACTRMTHAVAAYSVREYWRDFDKPGKPTELSTQHLVWAQTYLARQHKPYRCGIARYYVDHVDRPLGILPDRTALVAGLSTVIRIRLSDGSTDAPSKLVRQVPAREYIDTILLAGRPDCVAVNDIGQKTCHWIDERTPKFVPGSEDDYARRWFEGLDRTISRIYFNN